MKAIRRANSTSSIVRKVDEFLIGQLINQSPFSNVYVGSHNITRQKIAMKIISKRKMCNVEDGENILFAETMIYPYLYHQHIVKPIKCFENTNSVFQVMEYMPDDLLTYMQTNPLPYSEKVRILDQILSAIEYLHIHSICHRDIKLDNILLSEDHDAYLSDFGFSTFSTSAVTGFLGSTGYAAPEVLKKKPYDGIKADLWSTGVLIYALFAERLPFAPTQDMGRGLDPSKIDYSKIDNEIAEIVKSLLVLDPKGRAPICNIRFNEIFNSVTDKCINQDDIPDYTNEKAKRLMTEIFDDGSEKYLEAIGVNPQKIMYRLIEEQFHEAIQPYYTSLSCPLPDLNNSPNQAQVIEEVITIDDKFSSVVDAIRSHFLNRNFCVSMSRNGSISTIRNTLQEDINITVNISASDSKSSSVYVIGNDQDEIETLSQELGKL